MSYVAIWSSVWTIGIIATCVGTGLIPYLISSSLVCLFPWQPPKPPEHDPKAMPYRSFMLQVSIVKPWRVRWYERSMARWERSWCWLRQIDGRIPALLLILVSGIVAVLVDIKHDNERLDAIPHQVQAVVVARQWTCTLKLQRVIPTRSGKQPPTDIIVAQSSVREGTGDRVECPVERDVGEAHDDLEIVKHISYAVVLQEDPEGALFHGMTLQYRPESQGEFWRFQRGQVWSVTTYRTGRVDGQTLRRISPPEHDPLSTPHP